LSTTTTSSVSFPDATWRRLIDDSGLERDDPDANETWCSLVGGTPAEKFRRQVEAG
jgi:hypothetical protein